MKRPAFAMLVPVDVDVVHVCQTLEGARRLNFDSEKIRYVAATDYRHIWDWAVDKYLLFYGHHPLDGHPWDAMKAGVKFVLFMDQRGVMQQWHA